MHIPDMDAYGTSLIESVRQRIRRPPSLYVLYFFLTNNEYWRFVAQSESRDFWMRLDPVRAVIACGLLFGSVDARDAAKRANARMPPPPSTRTYAGRAAIARDLMQAVFDAARALFEGAEHTACDPRVDTLLEMEDVVDILRIIYLRAIAGEIPEHFRALAEDRDRAGMGEAADMLRKNAEAFEYRVLQGTLVPAATLAITGLENASDAMCQYHVTRDALAATLASQLTHVRWVDVA